MWRSTFRLAATLSLALCGPAHAQQWSAQRITNIGENEGFTFGRISGMALLPDGQLFVLDGAESRVHVLSAAGQLVRTFGRRGAGPGELSNLAVEVLASRGQIVVVDPLNQRLSLFNGDGSFVRSRPLNMMQGMPVAWAATQDRLVYLARPMTAAIAKQMGGITQHTIFALDPRSDAPPDTLLRVDLPPDNDMTMGGGTVKIKVDLRVAQLRLSGDGNARVLLAATDTYRIRVMGPDGKTTGWLSRAATRHRYTGAELARKKQQADSVMTAAFKSGAAAAGGRGMPRPEIDYVMPEFAPALSAIIAGERFVLVRLDAEEGRPTNWDILAYDGQPLGTLRLPANFRAQLLAGDRLYGVEKDELDVESVTIYRIAAPARR